MTCQHAWSTAAKCHARAVLGQYKRKYLQLAVIPSNAMCVRENKGQATLCRVLHWDKVTAAEKLRLNLGLFQCRGTVYLTAMIVKRNKH